LISKETEGSLSEAKSIAIVGATTKRDRYSNKAVRAYRAKGYTVYPVSIRHEEVEGLKAYRSVKEIPGPVDVASLYVNPKVGIGLLEEMAEKGVDTLFVNPGAESQELLERAESLGLNPILACSIMSLGIDPEAM
jgi:predicted CoA-binding protein